MLDKKYIEELGYFDLKGFIGNGLLHPGGLHSTIELLQNSTIKGIEPILEVGCGCGYSTLRLLKAGYNLQSIDNNPTMVQATKHNLKESGFIFNSPFECSAENLIFSDENFSLVLLEAVFGFIRNKEQAISEFRRVLKNNGMIGYVDMHYVTSPSDALSKELSAVFGYEIKSYFKEDWINLHKELDFDLHYWNDYPMNNAKMPTLGQLDTFLGARYKNSDRLLIKECAEIVFRKFNYYESTFIKNRKHLRYHVALFKKKS